MHPTPCDPGAPSFTRRRLLRVTIGGAALGLSAAALASPTLLLPTPRNVEGPFYPRDKPADSDADLTRVAGRTQRANGTLLYVTGRVVDVRGAPLAGAELELWQANAFGRYHHPRDSDASGRIDPDFQGYGRLVVDAGGNFRIKTIKPPPYSSRTPHIHFNAVAGGTRLTTQMFFEGEALNERDGLYRYLSRQDRVASTGRFVDRAPGMEADAVAVTWDIVLRT